MSSIKVIARPYAWLFKAASFETCLTLIDVVQLIPLKCEPVALCKARFATEMNSLRLTKRPQTWLLTSAIAKTQSPVFRAWGERSGSFHVVLKAIEEPNVGASMTKGWAAPPKARCMFEIFLLSQQRVRWTGSPKVKHRGFVYSHDPGVVTMSHTQPLHIHNFSKDEF